MSADTLPRSTVPHWQLFDQVPAFVGLIYPDSDATRKLKRGRMVGLDLGNKEVVLMCDPAMLSSPDWYHFLGQLAQQGHEISRFATASADLFDLLEYSLDKDGSAAHQRREDAVFIQEMLSDSVPIGNFMGLIKEVIETGASDVHLEIQPLLATVRVRIFGVMRRLRSYPSAMMIDAVSAGYTVLAEELSRTDAAFNARLPQAAMIPIEHEGRKYVLRYQSHPSVGGARCGLADFAPGLAREQKPHARPFGLPAFAGDPIANGLGLGLGRGVHRGHHRFGQNHHAQHDAQQPRPHRRPQNHLDRRPC